VFGGEKNTYEDLQARYLKLRNTDTSVSKVSEWNEVGLDLVAWESTHRKSAHAATALFDASIVEEKLFEVTRDDAHLNQSVRILDALLERHVDDALADDALVRKGDLYRQHFEDNDKAEAAYQRVLSNYPNSDMAEVARAKLRGTSYGASSSVDDGGVGPMVVLDPGHGGEDFGAQSPSGLLEKDVALDISRAVQKILIDRKIARVKLTRTSDEFVPLADRTAYANSANAELFVSIHSNASSKEKLSGLQTFYLDAQGDESSRLLAERENGAEALQGGQADLQFILSDLVQNAKIDDSVRLANVVHASVLATLQSRRIAVGSLGVRKAPFYVLVGAHMPCILIEAFFIDNPDDGKKLADKNFRMLVAQGIADGIAKYLRTGKK
jgi:N-acetylmuramoyl-L-alanine amidase